MRSLPILVGFTACFLLCGAASAADDLAQRAWSLEAKGDAAGAQALLREAAEAPDAKASTLLVWAEYLDVHRDPAARELFQRVFRAADDSGTKRAAARRLVLLDLEAGEDASAHKDLENYRAAGGTDLSWPGPAPAPQAKSTIVIPGPLRSFARMAALSPDLGVEDVIPALARNVVTNGYQAANSNEALEATEYLKLVMRYLTQARELEKLAGKDKTLRIDTCESSATGDLLRVLGYRMRGACGSDVVLETVNATRAFLTIDSGFPLAELEQSLRTSRPFSYPYGPTQVPILYDTAYWYSARPEPQTPSDFLDFLISDPSLCRLYLGLSKLEPQTADAIRKSVPAPRLRAYAHVLDFYGAMFQIRDGKAIVPGGAASEKAWADLTGVSPVKGGTFFERLIAHDDGWLASYFDALARITDNPANGNVQAYLTQPERLKRFYAAIRGKVTSPGPARPVFRANTDMLLLTTRLRLDPDGRPHIPGGVGVWRDLFISHPKGSKYDQRLTKSAPGWKEPDDVLEALFGLCRKSVENEPLKIFMSLSDVDRHRTTPLDPETAALLARNWHEFGAQYPILAEAHEISNTNIAAFIDMMSAINDIHDGGTRADAAGTAQSLIGLWQIFYRQGSIPSADANAVFAKLVDASKNMRTESEIFDAGRRGVNILLAATGAPASVSPQDRMVDLLAGTLQSSDSESHNRLVEDMIRIFESQRLISLKTLFDLNDQLEALAHGAKPDMKLIDKTAARISEIQLPRNSLSGVERNSLAFGYWPEKHIEAQRKLNLKALVDKAARDPKKVSDVSAMLAPFLRDTLVGLNYVHYAPPGAQILLTNPLFVRSHDFIGMQGSSQTWKATEVMGTGWPTSGGGKLVGSLVSVPYALAEAEQNFLIPSREQALIWGDLVPQMLVTATVPRWWQVSPAQLHWVGLHMDYAENLMAEAALNPSRREGVLAALANHAPPARVARVSSLLAAEHVRSAIDDMTPAEMFWIAADQARDAADPLAREIRAEAAADPSHLNYGAISRRFGTPKPTLANSYSPQLLNLRTFPTLMGYSSRILAESWESNLLYYAALADETHTPPSQLNVLVPAWTRSTVERIFATHLEDWPALLRSLRTVGDEVRRKSTAAAGAPVAGGF